MDFFSYFEDYYINLKFGPTFIITGIVFSLSIAIMFNPIQKKASYFLRLFIDFICVFIVQLLVNCLLHSSFEAGNVLSFDLYTMYYVWFIVAFIHSFYPNKTSYPIRFTYALFVNAFIVCLLGISGSIGNIFFHTTEIHNSLGTDITFYSIIFLTLACVIFAKMMPLEKYKKVPFSGIIVVDVVFVLSLVFLISLQVFSGESDELRVISSAILLIIDCLTYILFYITIRNYNHNLYYQAMELKVENIDNQIELASRKSEELHVIRHDIKNQFEYIDRLLKAKEYDKLNEYFNDLNEKTRLAVDYIDCGNSTLNHVLNIIKSKTDVRHLVFMTDISVPHQLKINDTDLVSMMVNLLDNAIEGTERSGKKGPINLKIFYQGNYLFINCSNPVDESIDPKKILSLKTSKTESDNHGYGHKIIKGIVTNYQGFIDYSIKDGYFISSLMLCLKKFTNEEEE
ncbi:MAG: GHKL domain-containing protein [Bacilli bacterium]